MCDIIDALFGAVGEPDWDKVYLLVGDMAATELTFTQIIKLQWLFYNEPEGFDDMVTYYVEIADGK